MKPLKYQLSKTLFAGYCGLVASGYDIGDSLYMNLANVVRETIHLDKACMDYFGYARLDTEQVNPYWPNGFLITMTCLYMDHYNRGGYVGLPHFVVENNQIPESSKNTETMEWLMQLPQMIDAIQASADFESLWHQVNGEMVDSCKTDKGHVFDLLQNKIGALKGDLSFKVILNPLQAYEIADFLSLESSRYIIISRISDESIIHEYLHIYFDQIIHDNLALTDLYSHLMDPVYEDMVKYQYATEGDTDSWRRVYKECFVRAATLWVLYHGNTLERESKIFEQEQMGFKYIRGIVTTFDGYWVKNMEADRSYFWKLCLDSCNNQP